MGTRVRAERSTSRSGLHTRVSTYFSIRSDCSRSTVEVLDKVPARPTYVKGEAYEVHVETKPDSFLVVLDMRRNPGRKVRGDIAVYNPNGTVAFRALYRKLKVRLVECYIDQKLAYSIIKCIVDLIKLPVKRYGISKCKI